MRHTLCLTTLVTRRQPDENLEEMIPHCPQCGRDVEPDELTDDGGRLLWEETDVEP